MIQLGDLPVISKIIDSYPLKTKFIILMYLSIDEYLNDNPEVDKRHGPTVVKFYSVWEEVSDKIQD